jgi:hypothetical protein
MDKNAFEVTKVDSWEGLTRNSSRILRDSAKRITTSGTGNGTVILIGSKLFLTMNDETLAPFERELATKLGLNLAAKNARVTAANLKMEASILRDATINDAKPEYWGSALEYVLGHANYCTIKNTGKDLLLNCKMVIDNTGLGEKQTIDHTTTISGGRLVKEAALYDGKTLKSTTYKTYKGTVKAPKGPYLEYDLILTNPGYEQAASIYEAQLMLNSFAREAKAMAAFESRDTPNIEDWKIVAEREDLKLYDRGIGYKTQLVSQDLTEVCGVFITGGAKLELVSCESLGFMRL